MTERGRSDTALRPRIVVLSGGLGGARLALAVTEAGVADDTIFVTNVADDWTVGALPVCPDTDAVLYALAGRFDEERGWGVRGDVFPGPAPGEPAWFGIGDLDRAHHERRAALLASGATFSEATAALAAAVGVTAIVTPVTDAPVRTEVRYGGRWTSFQEWLVRDHGPTVEDVRWAGLDRATTAPGVLEAIARADVVVLASSSPVASLAAILGVDGVRAALGRRPGPIVALSPVVVNRPPTNDRDRHRGAARAALLSAAGLDHTPAAVAGWLGGLITHFALDPVDDEWATAVAATGAVPVHAPVIGIDPDERAELLRTVIGLASWSRPAR